MCIDNKLPRGKEETIKWGNKRTTNTQTQKKRIAKLGF